MPIRPLLLALLALAAILAGACGGDDDPELARLDGGVAQGAGFEFRLTDEWSSLADNDREKLFAEYGRRELPKLDQAGLLAAGLWIKPEGDEPRPSVNVVAEPITVDTPLDAILAGSLQTIGQAGDRARPTEPVDLDGERGRAYRFTEVEEV